MSNKYNLTESQEVPLHDPCSTSCSYPDSVGTLARALWRHCNINQRAGRADTRGTMCAVTVYQGSLTSPALYPCYTVLLSWQCQLPMWDIISVVSVEKVSGG